MVSEPQTVHTKLPSSFPSFFQMAESSNTANTSASPLNNPNSPPPMTENITSLPITNIQSHIAPKLQLDEHNYMAWVFQFRPILRTNDLMGIVDGSEPCPPKFIPGPTKDSPAKLNPAFTLWEKKDQYLLSWFIATLSEKILSTVYGLETSRQVWCALANRFAAPSKTRIQELRRQLQGLRQGNKSCSDYVHAAKTLADHLAMVGKPVSDEDLISYIIGGLNPRYNAFITSFALMTKDESITLEDFQTLLISHEQLLNNQSADAENTSFALHAQKTSNSPHRPRFNPTHKQSQPRYSNSKQNQTRFSPQFSSQKKFIPGNSSSQGKSNSGSFTPNDSNRPPCQICGKRNHQALDCFHRMDYAYQGRHPPSELAAMVSQSNAITEEEDWLADSGANNHITANLENLSINQPYNGTEAVTVGNGGGLSITHTGSTSFNTPNALLHLKNVLCCPQASANLLSIQKFCKDNCCFFKLTDSYFLVKDNLTGEILLQGPSVGGLYPVNLKFFSKNKLHRLTAFLGAKTSSSTWHKRLGHPHHRIFQQIMSSNQLPIASSKTDSVCIDCQLAKSRQLPFPKSQTVTHAPLELVHSDIWTSPIFSISGCKYYAIFIDDFSRYSWLFPLKNKSDMLECFIKFKCLIENLLSCKIKQLQTDGGGEYTSHPFKQFLTTHGIHHRITCPHTSQQNGIAERKHRHVIETGLALLAQSHLPPKYWVEACLTAVYLINRMPSQTLHNVAPYTKLFKAEPSYSDLRVFGCACYPLLRPYNKHKLEFRSKQCIFLGYSSNHKGYRCMDPTTSRVYLSRNVVFDENLFPAQKRATAAQPSAQEISPANSFGLLPSHFYSLNSLPTTHTQNTSVTYTNAAGIVSPTTAPDTLHLDNVDANEDNTTSSQPRPASPSTNPAIPATDLPMPDLPVNTNTADLPASHLPNPPQDSLSPDNEPAVIVPNHQQVSYPQISSSTVPLTHRVTRSQTGSLKPKSFPDFKLYNATKHPLKLFLATTLPPEPTTYNQAASNPHWRAAMESEFQALLDNHTWTLCPRPSHRNIIKNKWVFKLKQKADGTIDR
jgi:transposase InsO family protein